MIYIMFIISIIDEHYCNIVKNYKINVAVKNNLNVERVDV